MAYFFDGIAGHSGIFTTAPDILRFIRILLNNGHIPGEASTLPADIVKQFTTAVPLEEYHNTRSYGFDTNCPSHKMSNCFGHDGSTGVSAWGDREHGVGIVVVTNRGHPDVKNNLYGQHRGPIFDAVMQALGF